MPAPLSMSDAASDLAEDGLFQVTPSTSPASESGSKSNLEQELDDLFPFMDSKEQASSVADLLRDLPVEVDICVDALGEDVTIDVNISGYGVCSVNLDSTDSEAETSCCLQEGFFSDVDVFGEEEEAEEVDWSAQAFLDDVEACDASDEDDDSLVQLRKDKLTMSFASDYISQVIQTVLDGACFGLGDLPLEPLPPPPAPAASVRADAGGALVAMEASPPSRPRSGLVSSRSRRRIIGAVVRSPAPAETSPGSPVEEAEFALSLGLSPKFLQPEFDVTPKPSTSGSSPSRHRSKSAKEKSSSNKKKSAGSFRMEFANEVSFERSSSLARGYDALGADIYGLQDDYSDVYAPSWDSLRWLSGREGEWAAPQPCSLRSGRTRLGHVQSASAIALDLGVELDAAPAKSSGSPQVSFSTTSGVRACSSTGSLGLAKSKKLQGGFVTAVSKRQGLLPDLPTSPSTAGSIAWSMRLAKTGARRSLASVF